MQSRIPFISAIIACVFLGSSAAVGQTQTFAQPQARILQSIDESTTITLHGNVHPLAATTSSSKLADPGTPMEHMILYLKPDAVQESQLEQLIVQQHDPKSALYHHFLTPQQFGAQFGVAQSDLSKITTWLQSHGFTVEQTPAGNRAVVFSGTSEQVTSAFKTEIRQYTVAGANHYANATDPQIPAALADAVGGVVKLHDFRHATNISKTKALTAAEVKNPQYTYGSGHYLAPSDYGILYDIDPLYTAGINGTGQTIAVLARSNIYLSDVQSFRSFSGLGENNPQILITTTDPGVLEGDSVETTLDTEWSGAVAPNATVKVIVAASTNSADGIDLSALYAVTNNIASIVSLSYGSCEAFMGSSELAFYNSLWQQAAAQGQSVMVSAGDAGAAGCDSGGDSSGYYGPGINGLCSSPYSTCVGGTEFVDTSNPGQYWLPGNNSANGSAISYIPETVWNESGSNGGSDLWAGGGGVSIVYSKPSWQMGPGVPADGKRDVPDISLTASSHDGYLIWLCGGLTSVGGTSAAAPSFAGLMALVDQKTNTRQGLVNTTLYPLAINQAAGGAAVFHDITTGNNTVPGVNGFLATTGYDQASGLGSVDAALLVNHWTDTSGTGPATLTAVNAPNTLSLATGGTASFTTTVTAGGTFKSAVTLTVSGVPAGITVSLSSSSVASPGSGSVTATVIASKTAAVGTYTLTVMASGGNLVAKATTTLTIVSPSFALNPSSTVASVPSGSATSLPVSIAPSGGFNSTVTLTASGFPAGVTASFSPTTLSGTATGTSTLTFTAAQTSKAGTYPVTIMATGGGLTKTATLSLTVTTPSFALTSSAGSATVSIGGNASVPVSVTPSGGFNSTVNLTASGLPTGVTASFSPASLSGTAAGTSTLTLTAAPTAKAGTYSVTITANGGGLTKTAALTVTIPSPSFSLTSSTASVSLMPGGNTGVPVSINPGTGFTSTVSLMASGLPAGVTASFSPASLSITGSAVATSIVAFTAGPTAKAGVSSVTITATGGGITKTTALNMTVTAPVTLALTASPSALSVPRGGSGQSVIMTAVTGPFTSPISLSASGMPSGVQASFNNTTVAAGTGNVITLSVGGNAALGTSTITITGTGGGVAKTVTVQLTVLPAPAFTLGLNNQFITVKAGGASVPVTMSITSTAGGFNSPISLIVAGMQSNIAQSFSSSTLTVAAPKSTLTVSAASNATPGIYTIALAGTSGTLYQIVYLSVTVTR